MVSLLIVSIFSYLKYLSLIKAINNKKITTSQGRFIIDITFTINTTIENDNKFIFSPVFFILYIKIKEIILFLLQDYNFLLYY